MTDFETHPVGTGGQNMGASQANGLGSPKGPEPDKPSPPVGSITSAALLTGRAREFARLNRSLAIVAGEWLDNNRRRVTGPPSTWTKLRYRFDNGQQITLNEDDRAQLMKAGYEPLWAGDSRLASGMSASGQDPKGLDAKPASPTAASGDAHPQSDGASNV